MSRGYFGIGVFHPKTAENIGTLYRSAYQLGASFIFTIGHRYKKTITDTYKAYRHIPLYQYEDLDDFQKSRIYDCRIIGIEKYREKEIQSRSLETYTHPERCIYLLGSEDSGLSSKACEVCHEFIELPSVREYSYNVATSGAIVMFHRLQQSLLSKKKE